MSQNSNLGHFRLLCYFETFFSNYINFLRTVTSLPYLFCLPLVRGIKYMLHCVNSVHLWSVVGGGLG